MNSKVANLLKPDAVDDFNLDAIEGDLAEVEVKVDQLRDGGGEVVDSEADCEGCKI